MKKNLISVAYVVPCANGTRENQAFGVAIIANTLNSFLKAAVRVGTHLRRAGFVRAVVINGVGHLAYLAKNGHCTKIGM